MTIDNKITNKLVDEKKLPEYQREIYKQASKTLLKKDNIPKEKDNIPKAFMKGLKILATKGPVGLYKSKEFAQGAKNIKDIVGSTITSAIANMKYNDLKRYNDLRDKAKEDAKWLVEETNRRKREEQMNK